MMPLFLLLTSGLVQLAPAIAMETDQLTCRKAERTDATAILNQLVGRQLEFARRQTQSEVDTSWSDAKIGDRFRQRVRERFKGLKRTLNATLMIERWMENTLAPLGYATMPRYRGRHLHLYDRYPRHLRAGEGLVSAAVFSYTDTFLGYTSANSFSVGGVLIGSDKIGHFIDQGYDYWLKSDHGRDEAAAIRFGTGTELGSFGLATTGVFSYGDLAANHAGYVFFKNLVGDERALYSIYRTYSGRVRILGSRSFDWADYVTPDWDELQNLSHYTNEVSQMVREHLIGFSCRICHEYAQWRGSLPVTPRLLPKESYVDAGLAAGMTPTDLFRLDELCSPAPARCAQEDVQTDYSCEGGPSLAGRSSD
ncbi:MAG: hypothetical protein HY075_03685 [Deltaproteobacteria bacterium]|nr:hypothetical protein [Deltaproteobacteria bacterium]